MDIYRVSGNPDSPLVVSVPHTGTRVPPEVRRRLAVPVEAARRRVDAHVWELARLAEPHATVIRAAVSRAVVDVNRSGAVSDVDLGWDPAGDGDRLVRLYDDQGGLLWRSAVGRPPFSRKELEDRVRRYHDPYHAALQECLARAGAPCALVDLHSMVDGALDIAIGDFRGRAAGVELCEGLVQPFFAERGWRAGYAGPRDLDHGGRPVPQAAIQHSGGFITSRYGDPAQGRYALQIEVNRERCRQDGPRVEQTFREFWARLESEFRRRRG